MHDVGRTNIYYMSDRLRLFTTSTELIYYSVCDCLEIWIKKTTLVLYVIHNNKSTSESPTIFFIKTCCCLCLQIITIIVSSSSSSHRRRRRRRRRRRTSRCCRSIRSIDSESVVILSLKMKKCLI